MGAKSGDRVRCVDAAGFYASGLLAVGREYVVDTVGEHWVRIDGINCYWSPYRFERVASGPASEQASRSWLSPEDLAELAAIAEEYMGSKYRRAVLHRALDAIRSATEAGVIQDGWYQDSVGGWRRRP